MSDEIKDLIAAVKKSNELTEQKQAQDHIGKIYDMLRGQGETLVEIKIKIENIELMEPRLTVVERQQISWKGLMGGIVGTVTTMIYLWETFIKNYIQKGR